MQNSHMNRDSARTNTPRPKISIYIATSIDGYIARKDGNLDWLQYGHTGDEDYGFKQFIRSIDALILGRKTYQVVSNFKEWPYQGKRVIVLSNTLTEVRKEAELFCGQLPKLLSKLHSENIRHIWVDGGITASNFLEADLVDELTISVIAMVLGSGIPLFSLIDKEHTCRLISAQSYASGLVQLKYEILRQKIAPKPPKENQPMFAVIYRGYVKTGHENQYINYWKTISSYFMHKRGALASTLHKAEDGMWIAYSKWPDKARRDASWPINKNPINSELPFEIQEAIIGLKQCLILEKQLPEIRMEVMEDIILNEDVDSFGII